MHVGASSLKNFTFQAKRKANEAFHFAIYLLLAKKNNVYLIAVNGEKINSKNRSQSRIIVEINGEKLLE